MKTNTRMIMAIPVMLVAGVFLMLQGLALQETRAMFSGTDASVGNSFTAAVSFDAYPDLVISNITVNHACAGAGITWNTDRPATSMVEWSATPGGPYTSNSDATLVTSHAVDVHGLGAGTWYFRVSSTDAGNQSAVSSEASFVVQAAGRPALSLSKNRTYWASSSDFAANLLSVEYRITNAGPAARNVQVVGTINTNGAIDVESTGIEFIPAGGSGLLTIKYVIAPGTPGFISRIYASSNDDCDNRYSYPGPWPGV